MNAGMEMRSLQFIADSCRATRLRGRAELSVSGLTIDSRAVRPGELFVAIRGDRFDGHDFLGGALERGAAAVLVERDWQPDRSSDFGWLRVASTRGALGEIAAAYRRQFPIPVICVAGSNGKTTTKELLGSMLRAGGPAVVSPASFNNDIGVPLTLLQIESAHRAAVVEVGTNHPGELDPLLRMSAPTHGILTSIGREHLEFFGSLEGVIEEEGTLAASIPESGIVFVNGDQPEIDRIRSRARGGWVRCGFGPGNEWRARLIDFSPDGCRFRVEAPLSDFTGEYRIRLIGRHQVLNATLALAAAASLGIAADEAHRGLEACPPAAMRMNLRNSNGITVIEDCYNANADSALAALQTLRDLPCTGRRWAVLGDMAELGGQAASAHAEVGRRAGELGLDGLFAVGRLAGVTAENARAAGIVCVEEHEELEAVVGPLQQKVKPGDVVLLKASRAARFERLAEALRPGG